MPTRKTQRRDALCKRPTKAKKRQRRKNTTCEAVSLEERGVYENFTTADGTKMYKHIKIEKGKVVSAEEKSGSIDLKKILEDLKKRIWYELKL